MRKKTILLRKSHCFSGAFLTIINCEKNMTEFHEILHARRLNYISLLWTSWRSCSCVFIKCHRGNARHCCECRSPSSGFLCEKVSFYPSPNENSSTDKNRKWQNWIGRWPLEICRVSLESVELVLPHADVKYTRFYFFCFWVFPFFLGFMPKSNRALQTDTQWLKRRGLAQGSAFRGWECSSATFWGTLTIKTPQDLPLREILARRKIAYSFWPAEKKLRKSNGQPTKIRFRRIE
jgi:hypothetical protein